MAELSKSQSGSSAPTGVPKGATTLGQHLAELIWRIQPDSREETAELIDNDSEVKELVEDKRLLDLLEAQNGAELSKFLAWKGHEGTIRADYWKVTTNRDEKAGQGSTLRKALSRALGDKALGTDREQEVSG